MLIDCGRSTSAMTKWVLVAFLLLTFSTAARGVAVSTSTGNTRPPEDDPGWNNVGIRNGSTAVYLGNQWVLTARHVGAGPTTFPQLGTFGVVPNSQITLQNPSNQRISATTDLVIYKLQEAPALPPVAISQESPPVGAEVVFIGNGRDRADELTHWDVSGSPFLQHWRETDTPADYAGFKTIGASSLRWGTNVIEDDEPFFFESDSNHTTKIGNSQAVVALVTEFDMPGDPAPASQPATLYESQAVTNDSGGAMFYKNGDQWELAGIIIAVEGFNNQPNVTRNPVFGNLTLSADLATYRQQIAERYLIGDFDQNGRMTPVDVDLLSDAINRGIDDPALDLNNDGTVNAADRTTWVEQINNTYFGDSNLDGEFDSADFIIPFQAETFNDGIPDNASWESGDWDGDGEFETSDLVVAFQSSGYEQGKRLVSAANNVPEPNYVLAFGLAFVVMSRSGSGTKLRHR